MKIRGFIMMAAGCLAGAAGGAEPAAYDLEAAVHSGLRNNLALQNLQLDVLRAEGDIDLARSIYDAALSGIAAYEDSELPSQNVPVQGATKSLFFGGGYSRRLTSGTGLNLEASSGRLDFAESFSPVNPLHISSVILDVDHPLWGGGGTEDRARIQLTESVRDTVALEFYVQQDQVAAGIEHAYWLGFLARSQYTVNRGVLERARQLLETNKTRFEEGLLDETDILAAEAALALTEVDVINFSNACEIAEDLIRERMNLTPDAWDEVTFTYPPLATLGAPDPVVDVGEAEQVALASRPELYLLRAAAARAADEVALRREELKGGVSLTGRVGVGESADEWADSLDPARSVWGVGIRYDSTVGRDAERSRLRQAEVEVRRVENQYLDTLRTITWQIRRAVRSLETSVKRIAAADRARLLQQRKLELEQKKFDQGRSTTRDVIEYQDDLAFAEFQTVEAVVRHRRALTDVRLAQGTIVDKDALWSGAWREPGDAEP